MRSKKGLGCSLLSVFLFVLISAVGASANWNVSTQTIGHGQVSPTSKTVADGSDTFFTVTPDSGYQVSSITGCGGSLSGSTYFTGPIASDCTIAATFTVTITPSRSTHADIGPSSVQTIPAGTTKQFLVIPDAGYMAKMEGTCGGSPQTSTTFFTFTTNVLYDNCTVIANSVAYRTVTPAVGTGSGTIAPSTAQIVEYNTSTSFTLAPGEHWRIGSVTGTCGGSLSGSAFTTNAVTSNCTVVANFAPITYDVTSSVTNSAGGSITPASQSIQEGETATFTLSPSTGYIPTAGGTCPAGTLTGNIYTTGALTGPCEVIATFISTWTVTPTKTGSGTISPSTPQTGIVDGATVDFDIVPALHYRASVGGTCGGSFIDADTYRTAAVNSNCTVVVTFSLITYTVTPQPGLNGSMNPSDPQVVQEQTTTTFQILPNSGYTIDTVNGCSGALDTSATPATYTTGQVNADCTVTASFIVAHTVTPSSGSGGSLSPATPQTIGQGGTKTFLVLPNAGYIIDTITGCGGTLDTSVTPATYTTGQVNADCTIAASFLASHTVTPSAGAGGSLSPATPQQVGHERTTTFQVLPNPGYTIGPVTGCNGALNMSVSPALYTTGTILADCTVTASFNPVNHTATSSGGSHGTVTPLGPQSVLHGFTATFSVTPDSGYQASVGGTCGGTLNTSVTPQVFTTNPIMGDCTVEVSFSLIPFDPCVPNLTHYWRFDEASSPYSDSIGSDSATCTACPTSVNGVVNQAKRFVPTSYVNAPDDNTFEWAAADSFSLEFWIKTDAASTCAGNQVAMGRVDSSGQLAWWVGCKSGGFAGLYLRDTAGNSASLTGTSDMTEGAWHHVVAVRDGLANQVRLYVDGTMETSASATFTGTFASVSAPLNIGWLNWTGVGEFHFDGTLDEAAIYGRALTENEIRSHYYLAREYCGGCASSIKIMPLGDSITAGTMNGTPNDQMVSYRQKLYLDLTGAGFNIDFVGSQQSGASASPFFDIDHEGRGGYCAVTGSGCSGEIASNVYNWLTANPADVVLLHIGTNDISGSNQSSNEVGTILSEIDRYNPNVTVVLAKIISRTDSLASATTQFNNDLVTMANNRIAGGDKIILVNQENALSYPADMSSTVHPNQSGYEKMTSVWFNALNTFMAACQPVPPSIYSTPVTMARIGRQYSYDANATGAPSPTYSLTAGPSWLAIDSHSGVIQGMPPSGSQGSHEVTVRVENGFGADTQTFTVNVYEAASPLSKTGWSLVYVDSYQDSGSGAPAAPGINAFDDNPGTIWQTKWYPREQAPSFPHEIQIDLGAERTLEAFRYLPRQDIDLDTGQISRNGRLKDYEFYVSNNSSDFGTYVARGALADTADEKEVIFTAKSGRYIRLKGLSTFDPSVKSLSMAEISVVAVSTYTVSASSGGNGTISCSPTQVSFGNSASCMITPNAGYSLSSLLDNGVNVTASVSGNTYTIGGVGENHNVVASFGINSYQITTNVTGNGTITCTQNPVPYDGSSTCTITPQTGQHIVSITVDSSAQTGFDPKTPFSYTFTAVREAHTISAVFEVDVMTISASSSGSGAISCPPTVNYGSSATCTLSANPGNHLLSLSDNEGNVTGSVTGDLFGQSGYQISNATTNHTISATFVINSFAIAVNKQGEGSVACTPDPVDYGQSTSCTMTPGPGYYVDIVTGTSGYFQASTGKWIFSNVTSNQTLNVTFRIYRYDITVSAGPNGQITPGAMTVDWGTSHTFTVTPDIGHRIQSISIDGAPQQGFDPYAPFVHTFPGVQANHSISAAFAVRPQDEDFETGDLTKFPWVTGGEEQWLVQDSVKHNELYAGMSPLLTDNQTAYMEVTLNVTTADNIYFWHKTSADAVDALAFRIDGAEQGRWTGEADWAYASFPVTVGQHTFRWEYTKDASGAAGGDAAWLDNITFPAHELVSYNVTSTTNDQTKGTAGPSALSVYHGKTTSITVSPAPGHHIVSVAGCGIDVTGDVFTGTTYTTGPITADCIVAAAFEINTYAVNGSTSTPELGGISCAPNPAEHFSTAACTMTANAGHHLLSLTDNGDDKMADATGNASDTMRTYTIQNLGETHDIVAAFAINAYTISFASDGNGSTCTPPASVDWGTNWSCTVNAAQYHHIVEITINGTTQTFAPNTTASLQINLTNITADQTVLVKYAPNLYPVTATVTGGEGALICSPNPSPHGANTTCTATPAQGYIVWQVNTYGQPVVTNSYPDRTEYVFQNVTGNRNIDVSFFRIYMYDITVTFAPSAGGSAACDPNPVPQGQSSLCTVTLNTGYHADTSLVDGGAVQLTNNSYSFSNVNAIHSFSVTFAINNYALTTGTNGTGTGSVSGGGTYSHGTAVNIQAAADVSSDFVSWSGDAECSGSAANPLSVSMTAPKSCVASFAIKTFTITPDAVQNGMIACPAGPVNYGSNAVCTVTPVQGYHVASVTVDGQAASLAADGTYTFNNVTGDHTIGATFAQNTYDVIGSAKATVIDFEGFADGTALDDEYQAQGVTFPGSAITSCVTPPACGEYPPYSGVNAITNAGSTIQAVFDTTVTGNIHAVSARVTGMGDVVMKALDGLGAEIASSQALGSLYEGVGAPNLFLSVHAANIARVDIEHAGGAFTVDDLTILTSGGHGSVSCAPNEVGENGSSACTMIALDGHHLVSLHDNGALVDLGGGPVTGDPFGTSAYNLANVTDNHTVVATYSINEYTLSMGKAGNGDGSVSVNGTQNGPQGFGTYEFNHGDPIAILAVPNAASSTFSGWEGDCSSYDTTNPIQTTITGAMNCTARFTLIGRSLTLGTADAGGGGTGSVSADPSGPTYNHGQVVTVTATPDAGSIFENWSGDCTGTANPAAVTMDGPKTCTANFRKTYLISVNFNADGSVTPDDTAVPHGSSQGFTITPDSADGYRIESIVVDGSTNIPVTNPNGQAFTFTGVTTPHALNVVFSLRTYPVTVTSVGHGSVTPGTVQVVHGANQSFVIQPEAGYFIQSLKIDGVAQTIDDRTATYFHQFANVTAPHSVEAIFDETFEITVTATGSGTVTPGTTTVLKGGSQGFTLAPAANHHIVEVLVDAVSQGPITTYGFTNVTADHTLSASFEIDTYPLNVSLQGNGNGTVTGAGVHDHGEPVTLTALPAENSSFAGWGGDCSVPGATNPTAVYMDGPKNCTATFTVKTYTLNITASNGTVAKNPNQETYDHGTGVELTATPNAGYDFTGWSGDCAGNASPVTVTMNSNRSCTATFTIKTYTLSITAHNGTVTRNPDKAGYDNGTNVELTAVADEGYRFTGWSGDASGTANPATVAMIANRSVTAAFESLCSWTVADATHLSACVGDGATLQQCLVEAGADGKHNAVMVVQGTYNGNFAYAAEEDFDLGLTAGYDASCTARSYGPALTVLDGDADTDGTGDGVVLSLASNGAAGNITVEGFHVKNGVNTLNAGGGIQASVGGGSVTLTGNVVSNSSAVSGGGIGAASDSGGVFLANNVVYGNTAGEGGGVLVGTITGAVTVLNNTVSDNGAASDGGGIAVLLQGIGAADLTNNIIWGNTAPSGGDIAVVNSAGGAVEAFNNDFDPAKVAGTFTVSGANINVNPHFLNAAGGDYHIDNASMCVDSGDKTAPDLPTLDIDGGNRVVVDKADLGADEAPVCRLCPPVSAVTVSSDKSSPQPLQGVGTVTFTAIASGGSGNYEYQFWLKNLATGVWAMVRDYSSVNTWGWTPGQTGNYVLSVYSRNTGSTAGYQAIKTVNYTISGTVSAVNLTADKRSPQPLSTVGTVTFTAVASGGSGNYQYQFWLKSPSGIWTMVRDYSSVNTWGWTPGQAGSYNVSVYARNLGSSASWEAIKAMPFEVSIPVSSVSLTVDKESPYALGTGAVTFTATASGGSGSYEYRFWRKDLSTGVWTMVQNYGSVNTWSWTPAQAGGYIISVYARNAGSSSSVDALMTMNYTVQLAAPPVSSVSLTADKASPRTLSDVGTVTFTAAASGGSGSYEYQFWLKTPSGVWTKTQNYGSSGVWSWTPAQAGSHSIAVYARNAGSIASYEAFKTNVFLINP